VLLRKAGGTNQEFNEKFFHIALSIVLE